MIYLLDTNVCVRYLNGRSLSIKEHLQTIDAENITVCSIVKAEMFFGAMRSNHPTNTVRLSPPAPNFGGAIFVKVPQDWGI